MCFNNNDWAKDVSHALGPVIVFVFLAKERILKISIYRGIGHGVASKLKFDKQCSMVQG